MTTSISNPQFFLVERYLNEATVTTLYRMFEEEGHAQEFLQGKIRFTHIYEYRFGKDASRTDPEEGTGRVYEWRDNRTVVEIKQGQSTVIALPGEVERTSDLGNVVFICCFTSDRSKKITGEFGKFVVEILDLKRLLQDMRQSLDANCSWQKNATIELWPVDYSKGLVVEDKQPDLVKRAVAQKPPSFSYQCESRIVLISYRTDIESVPANLYLSLIKPLEYARLLRC